ncbi:hypothetical protein QF038_004448, partial [Pseudarthrobacter sp. W1I19]|nr:hypothetical protein [Pseudarthrobacter sp. W1I19]
LEKLCKSAFQRSALPSTVPTQEPARQRANHFQAVCQGVGRTLSASAAATQKTIHAHTPTRKSTTTHTPHPQKPTTTRICHAKRPHLTAKRRIALLWSRSHIGSSLSAPKNLHPPSAFMVKTCRRILSLGAQLDGMSRSLDKPKWLGRPDSGSCCRERIGPAAGMASKPQRPGAKGPESVMVGGSTQVFVR